MLIRMRVGGILPPWTVPIVLGSILRWHWTPVGMRTSATMTRRMVI
ncbi:MAG: hypothetical protein ACFFB5_23275 [Promethearchaeota archaeon]